MIYIITYPEIFIYHPQKDKLQHVLAKLQSFRIMYTTEKQLTTN